MYNLIRYDFQVEWMHNKLITGSFHSDNFGALLTRVVLNPGKDRQDIMPTVSMQKRIIPNQK